jgi:sugar transferase (PEP-CTERM/EpsH1 system associated)
MKLLWVKSDFLHPTNRGGQIRTLETLKRLHARHEVHYVALNNPPHPEALGRALEYCSKVYAIDHFVPERGSARFFAQAVWGIVSPLPVAVSRYRSDAMKRKIDELTRSEKFDAIVCDFLFPAPNMPDLSRCVLFQHNVESMIWKRHVEHAANPLKRAYFQMQARRMFAFEREVCRAVKNVIAVSDVDAAAMRDLYGATRVAAVPTGVDLDYFAPQPAEPQADLVFVGSMDWMANIDAVTWFAEAILPLIRKRRPATTVAIVGRKPSREVTRLGETDPDIRVTGTVAEVRPYLWGALVSIVPLRIGGGTRLKIYEAMAARVPVVSTAVGAEGLDVENGRDILIADQPEDFAERCIELLESEERRRTLANSAWEMLNARYSWDAVTSEFERLLWS